MSARWREWAGRADLSESVQRDGELCLNEAAANIVLHGSGDSSGHEISLRFELRRRLETTPIGGLGVGLIRSFTSDVQYRFEAGRNVLTLCLPIG
jgi:anti-sigma regulatory factor (Ser/Thr protein kinase)